MIAQSALTLLQKSRVHSQFIPFGCVSLDREFKGIPIQGITEISGEAGSGKTQICLSLAIQAVINPISKTVDRFAAILSCGEGLFPIKRLSQLAMYYEAEFGISSKDILSHIDIEQCNNVDQATDTLFKLLPEMCCNKSVQLVIIDSLAGLLRFEYNLQKEEELRERTQYLFSLAAQLKWLSETYETAVLVVNQVTADFRYEDSNRSIPALGLAWSHCLNSRYSVLKPFNPSILLQGNENDVTNEQEMRYLNKENDLNQDSTVQKRKLSEVFTDHGITTTLERNENLYTQKKQQRILKLDFSALQPRKQVPFEIRTQENLGFALQSKYDKVR